MSLGSIEELDHQQNIPSCSWTPYHSMALGFLFLGGEDLRVGGCRSGFHFHRCTMWNYSAPHSLLLQYGDDYGTFFYRPTILFVAFPSGI